ncbi:Alcohol dehydrogenase [Streptococcus pyogenes MGAS2096]|nr:Alcohol dehydrogenase [Streptococcus pyogenes MGAS2096]
MDINNDKLELAKEVGADIVVNGKEIEDVPGYIQEKTGGAHGVVVTAVSKVAFNQAIDSVRAGGTVVAVGSSIRIHGTVYRKNCFRWYQSGRITCRDT